MAARTIATDKRALHAATLAVNTDDTVTFTDRYVPAPTVIIHPSADLTPVYVTADGSDPNPANGTACVVFPGGAVVPPTSYATAAAVPTVLRIRSAAAAVYSVEVG